MKLAAAEPGPASAEPPPDARAGEARTAESVAAWKFFAEVRLAAPEKDALLDFVLPPSVFDAARIDLADLRLYDAQWRDVPYALRVRNEVDTTEAVPAKEFNRVPGPSGASQLALDLGEQQIEHNEVEIHTPGTNFRRRVLLEGSDDGNAWSQLAQRDLVHYPSGEKAFVDKTLSYTPSRYRYLRMTVARDPQNDIEAIEIGTVVVRRRVKIPGELDVRSVSVGERAPVRADGGPGSSWLIDLQGKDVPVDRLLVTVADEAFVRNYYIEAGGPPEANERFWWVTNGVWQRRAGEPQRDMVAEFGQEVRAARLRLVVTDHSNPALRLESVRAAAPARVIIARQTESAAGPWRLYFGNPKAEAPNYDFARNLPPRIVPPPDRVQLGPRQENPTYQPEPLPLTERLPWLIYVLLSAAVAVLALLIGNLARASIRIADLRETAT
jgi:hypothetical protein